MELAESDGAPDEQLAAIREYTDDLTAPQDAEQPRPWCAGTDRLHPFV